VDNFLRIAEVVALLSASALCAYLIVVLVRLNGMLEMLQKDFAELNRNLVPVLENINSVAEKMKSITTKVDEQVNIFKSSLEALRLIAENVLRFEERVEHRIEEPIIRLTSIFGNLVGRVASFFAGRAAEQSN